MKLMKRVALITGAASGMGRSSALLFAREGAKVAAVDIDSKGGEETIASIKQKGGEAIFIQADVSKAADVERMIKKTIATYGRIDILFNNAGIPLPFTVVEEVKEEDWDRAIAINLKSVYLGCKYAIPIMKKQGGGVIINTASIVAVRPRPGTAPYLASKSGVIGLTKGIALEVAAHNIRVNCINPVAAETAFSVFIAGATSMEDEKYLDYKKKMVAGIPLGRMTSPEDVAYAALYLASDEASFITGVSLDVDGGRAL